MVDDASLAPLTTLQLGGRARHLIDAADEATVVASLDWAAARGLPVFILGGGSNVVIADGGFDGLVVRMGLRGLRFENDGDRVLVHAAAGESWDVLVKDVVARGWAGMECLAGIPGLVGATPIQNVGAYGQEVADTIRGVRAIDRATGETVDIDTAACAFGYRDSLFKRRPDAYVVLGVTFALVPGGAPHVRYGELEAVLSLSAGLVGRAATIADVSETVRTLRRKKSMLIDDAEDANRRSVGSFFTNPVLGQTVAGGVVIRAIEIGAARGSADVPQFPVANGGVKLSAAWLIEHAGYRKAFRRGQVGISTNHALALVHHGGGRTTELLDLAHDIQEAVRAKFGVTLAFEPTLVGAR
ncbi:MAG: UDP-N-acetylmuramate dehydrogenase [Deltaproteobacteria bacterium]|nr:UDP-N-acetylmuramate dehydrogenase [Deltaproteobacteria bacterium]